MTILTPTPKPIKMPLMSPGARGGHAVTMPRTGSGTGHTAHTGAGAAASGLPKMESSQEIQAKANAQAWKSVQQMMGQLPTWGSVDQPFTAQRAAIQPLVDAHRNWLLNAGMYQTKVTNGIAQLLGGQVASGDAGVGAGAAVAGAAPGSLPATNVSSGAVTGVPVALGGSAANYFQSLAPFATAQGIGNVGLVNANENTALKALADSRLGITNQLGDLQSKNFSALSTTAFDQYKSELAALAADQAVGLKTASAVAKAGVDSASLAIKQQNADTASKRVGASTAAAATKAQAALSKSDKTLTIKAIQDARKTYSVLGGVKSTTPGKAGTSGGGPYAYKAVIQLTYPKNTITQSYPPPKAIPIYGASAKEVQDKIRQYELQNKPKPYTDNTVPVYTNTKGIVKGPEAPSSRSGAGSSVIKDRPSETTRRLRAWRTFKTELDQLNSPLSTTEMQAIFRSQFGDPGK